jgi:hypothetical protein
MGKEADREKSIMSQIIKLHKKIDYLTDEVMTRLDKISNTTESNTEFPFEPQGIKSISIKRKEENE